MYVFVLYDFKLLNWNSSERAANSQLLRQWKHNAHSLLYNTYNIELTTRSLRDRFRDRDLLFGIIFFISWRNPRAKKSTLTSHKESYNINNFVLLGDFVATFSFSRNTIVRVYIRKEHYAILSSTRLARDSGDSRLSLASRC